MEFLYVAVGVISGITSGLFGLGGGTIIVPIMLSLGFGVQQAIGISVLQMMFASVVGSIINYKKKLFSLKDGILLGLGGIIGASFSGMVLKVLSETQLTFLFLCLMCFSFYKFLKKKPVEIGKNQEVVSQLRYASILIFTGVITGIFAVSLGVGGGLIMMPILMYFLGFSTKYISALSLFFIVCSSISGAFSLWRNQVIDSDILSIGLIVGISAVVGVSIGIYLIQKITAHLHKSILSCIYIFAICVTIYHLF
ncbi:sulfite exporter TauE/SafE family protein [Helicobacter anatolicus]|uniref:sulfite exporter TauE/SafE family protein n=1 Tax=Helicobacter anatolicus TaxID=2905874 RepID=UPI001E596FD5|nr:sulfite exporter TauE/SafE family protein [Helicobacter anatolicus]MCE3038143.1 sulfite exporter TauE/SafE family protein [Helicobacter anatolicus]